MNGASWQDRGPRGGVLRAAGGRRDGGPAGGGRRGAQAASWLSLAVAGIALGGCRSLLGLDDVELTPPADEPCPAVGLSCATETVLRQCTAAGGDPVDTVCGWGCATTGAPRCAQLVPAGGVVNRVDALGPRLPPTLLRDVVVDTDTGEITGVREGVSGLAGGVDFEIRRINAAMLPSVGVFSFGPLDIQGAVTVRGSRAVAFVVGGDARIAGVVDVRGSCLENAAGPGGYRGGYSVEWSTPAEGSGPGEEGEPRRGGGGGGHGGAGGAGSGPSFQTAPGGPIAGTAALLVLAGGSGGGAGALIAFPQGDPLYGGAGGGGGGAIQIVATGSLTVTGAEDGGPGGINAGGCGGKGGWGSGGGGGAGGAILLEAPVVRLEAGARLAANGGGGAAISSLGAAQSGQLDATRAAGSGVPPNVGGLGGASGEVGGGNGASTSSRGGSGGGGAAGRIRISTRTGLVERDASVIVSPGPEDAGPVTVFVPGTVE